MVHTNYGVMFYDICLFIIDLQTKMPVNIRFTFTRFREINLHHKWKLCMKSFQVVNNLAWREVLAVFTPSNTFPKPCVDFLVQAFSDGRKMVNLRKWHPMCLNQITNTGNCLLLFFFVQLTNLFHTQISARPTDAHVYVQWTPIQHCPTNQPSLFMYFLWTPT